MANNPLENYEQRAREDRLSKSTVTFFLSMIRQDDEGFDNDAILRMGKKIHNEIVKVVSEMEGNGNKI